jgi:putative component of membrane protein insertase Oxa1/YidC/SpoIIIJ protein YidD
MESVRRHGFLKGSALAISRLFRCNGWLFDGGDDPVPEQFSWKAVADGYRKFFLARRKHDKHDHE